MYACCQGDGHKMLNYPNSFIHHNLKEQNTRLKLNSSILTFELSQFSNVIFDLSTSRVSINSFQYDKVIVDYMKRKS